MTAEAKKIFEQALALPEQERAALIEGDEAIIYAIAHQYRKPGYWRDRLK